MCFDYFVSGSASNRPPEESAPSDRLAEVRSPTSCSGSSPSEQRLCWIPALRDELSRRTTTDQEGAAIARIRASPGAT